MNDAKKKKVRKTASEELEVLTVRFSLAHAFIIMLNEAYDALQTYGVNYRSLPEWQDSEALDRANGMPIHRAQEEILGWIVAMQMAIRVAVRRKQFKAV